MRVRITFAKRGTLRYTGHLDLHKMLERSIRRAALPLAYSQGYHPQPKLNLAAALPLGFASRAEVMDVWLNEDVEDVVSALQDNVPPGLTILQATKIDERAPSLQSQVIAGEYQVEIVEERRPAAGPRMGELVGGRRDRAKPAGSEKPGLEQKIASLLAAESLPRERRGKKYDLRPLVEELSPLSFLGRGAGGEDLGLFMRLTAREGATGRPEEVLGELGIPLELCRVERTALIFAE